MRKFNMFFLVVVMVTQQASLIVSESTTPWNPSYSNPNWSPSYSSPLYSSPPSPGYGSTPTWSRPYPSYSTTWSPPWSTTPRTSPFPTWSTNYPSYSTTWSPPWSTTPRTSPFPTWSTPYPSYSTTWSPPWSTTPGYRPTPTWSSPYPSYSTTWSPSWSTTSRNSPSPSWSTPYPSYSTTWSPPWYLSSSTPGSSSSTGSTSSSCVSNEIACGCDDNHYPDYLYSFTCMPAYGSYCGSCDMCDLFPNMVCGPNMTCECKLGFQENNNVCEPVLGRDCSQHFDADCDTGAHILCDSHTYQCICETGFSEYNSQCLPSHCHVDVPLIPDIHRRSASFVTTPPAISDGQAMVGVWYSIGSDTIALSDPGKGKCGTLYPIYLDGDLTQSQLTQLEAGAVLTITAKISGLQSPNNEIQLRLRFCGQDAHIQYLSAPPTHMSALCVGNATSPTNTNTVTPFVYASLNFTTVTENGVDYDEPFVEFLCIYNETFYDYFYRVTWYLDDDFLVSFEGLSGTNFYEANITDIDLLQNVGANFMNKKLRCSVDYCTAAFQSRCNPTFSEPIFLGVEEMYSIVSTPGVNSTIVSPLSGMPLGCKAPVGSTATNCSLTFAPVDDSTCPASAGASGSDRYEPCGVTLIGLTKYGNDLRMSSALGVVPVPFVYNVSVTAAGTIQEIYGTHLSMPAQGHNARNVVAADLNPTAVSTGHQSWLHYAHPSLKNLVLSGTDMSNMELSAVTVQKDPLTSDPYINKTFVTYATNSTAAATSNSRVNIVTPGTYMLMRSRTEPFTVQFTVESCLESVSGVCLCGFHIHDGNDYYTEGDCDGVNVKGLVSGDGQNYHTSFLLAGSTRWYRTLNGMLVWGENTNSAFAFRFFDTIGESFADHEGIVGSLTETSYLMRDGSSAADSVEFLSDWIVTGAEDLTDPTNHITYKWSIDYTACGCPNIADSVPEDFETVTDTHTIVNKYTGYVSCDLQTTCTHTGQDQGAVWSPLSANLDQVNVTANLSWSNDVPSAHLKCKFDVTDGFNYKVEWLSSGSVVTDSGVVTAAQAQAFQLSEADVTNVQLDAELQCRVSVYSGSDFVMSRSSAVFIPVEVQTRDVYLTRGSSTNIILKKKVPYGCSPGQANCCLQFLVYDPEYTAEADCLNSSLAVRSASHCGKQARSIEDTSMDYDEDENVSFEILTKNNDNYQLKSEYTLYVKAVTCDGRGGIWDLQLLTPISVHVVEQNSWQSMCSFNNDPRGWTYDGLGFNLWYPSTFIIHRSGNMEIQMETETCNFGASCVCGVAVRAGRHACAVNMCGSNMIVWEKNYESSGSRILKCYRSASNKNVYMAKFPQGTWAYLEIFPWGIMNLNVFASPADYNNVEGLCGNFNGNSLDEYQLRDGTIKTSDDTVYGAPDYDFAEDWRVKSEAGDINIVYQHGQLSSSVSEWDPSESYCTCNDAAHVTSSCFADEEDTCTASARKKRSTANDERLANKESIEKIRNQPNNNPLEASVTGTNPDAITEAVARQKCLDDLSTCGVYNMNKTDNLVNKTKILDDCTRDQMLNGSLSWGASYCSQSQTLTENVLERNNTFTEAEPTVQAEVNEVKCPGACSGQGLCVNGACQCNAGYGSSDCSNLASKRVTTKEPEQKTIPRSNNCYEIEVETEDTISDGAVCRIVKRTIKGTNQTDSETQEIVPIVYGTIRSGECCSSSRRRRSTSQSSTNLGSQNSYALSNDGVTFSDPITVYSIDTTCLNVTEASDGTFSAVVLSGYCVIGGDCYTNATQNPSNVCQYCSTDLNVYDWTNDNITESCQATTAATVAAGDDEGMSGGVIAAIIICTLLGVWAAAATAVVVYIKWYKPRLIRPTGLFDGPSNAKFDLRRDPTLVTKDQLYNHKGPVSLPGTPVMPESVTV